MRYRKAYYAILRTLLSVKWLGVRQDYKKELFKQLFCQMIFADHSYGLSMLALMTKRSKHNLVYFRIRNSCICIMLYVHKL
jgi:hypothetical protein